MNLFNGGALVDLGDAARTLDGPTWQAVLEALHIIREA